MDLLNIVFGHRHAIEKQTTKYVIPMRSLYTTVDQFDRASRDNE
jgi:hypothetical protein